MRPERVRAATVDAQRLPAALCQRLWFVARRQPLAGQTAAGHPAKSCPTEQRPPQQRTTARRPVTSG